MHHIGKRNKTILIYAKNVYVYVYGYIYIYLTYHHIPLWGFLLATIGQVRRVICSSLVQLKVDGPKAPVESMGVSVGLVSMGTLLVPPKNYHKIALMGWIDFFFSF